MPADKNVPILVADDYREMTSLIRKLLNWLGYSNIDEVTDGEQALKKLREKPYSVVIADWNMAPVNGYELLKEVRGDSSLASLPFIMISGGAEEDRVMSARDAGATHYIGKPFTARTLERSLAAALSRN